MHHLKQLIVSILAISSVLGPQAQAAPRTVGSYLITPDSLPTATGTPLEIERGLLFVPENRNNPESRTIAVNFVRLPALSSDPQTPRRPPVFLLPGGPGSELKLADPNRQKALAEMRRTRDVVYVSQRGNPAAPGLVTPLRIQEAPAALDQPTTAESTRSSQRAAVTSAFQHWSARGVDLRGYDILNIVDDVHELRAALGYDKIVLRGCSFGSQWSLAYLKRWPQTVDRAWLSGVEPLDYTYDSPAWLWASMARLAQRAESDPALKKQMPKGGLMAALSEVVDRLAAKPVTVTFTPRGDTKEVSVVLGAEDVRQHMQGLASSPGSSARQRLTNWPLMVLEMHAGDYRYLAAKRWEKRVNGNQSALILPLIDNSLDITAARDAKLRGEREARWLGDINDLYHNTRDLTPTAKVDDAFRADWRIDVPVLMTNGDLDWSTPLENSRHIRKFLAQGHLVEVAGGTHCTEMPEMTPMLPDVLAQLNQFLDVDFAVTTPAEFFKTLPSAVAYPALEFRAPTGTSLFDEWRAASGS